MTGREMREARAPIAVEIRKLADLAADKAHTWSAEDEQKWSAVNASYDDLSKKIELAERAEKIEAEQTQAQPRQGRLERADSTSEPAKQTAETRVVQLRPSVAGDPRSITVQAGPEADRRNAAFRRYLVGGGQAEAEYRALQKDSDIAGGYLSATEQFVAELIQALDNLTFFRQNARVLPALATATSLGAPSLDADPADPTWVTELQIGTEDSTMTFGKRELAPHPLAQWVKVSKTLLRRSAISADTIVRDRLAYKTAVVQENAFLNGSGTAQPLGVFTASNDGISTSRDVSTGNTTTSITFDGLMNAVYSLPAQYRRRSCKWIFHRDAIKQMRKLKDGEGRYIWQQSVTAGEPDTILAYPVLESEYAPSTFTTGLYVGILGDLSYYWIVDSLSYQIQVLEELYAATNQNGYISRSETDGMPVLEAAFARIKLA